MKIINIIGIVLLCISFAHAIPTPHGIDGTIYELDGITPIPNIDFYVQDINTNEIIQSKTRNDGSYSISLNGFSGDIIILKAWNQYNQNNRTFPLDGVMHNVNLLFNNTLPNLPPELTIDPIFNATVNKLFVYYVNATDPNNDILTYSLNNNSESITINNETGLIKWIPTNQGVYNFQINVNDGTHTITIPISIIVLPNQNSNNPPIITSSPITTALIFHKYMYDVEAHDIDNDKLRFYLIEHPRRMKINRKTGLIKWFPLFRDFGQNKVKVLVSDGITSTIQEFNIFVSLPQITRNSNTLPIITQNHNEDFPIEKIISNKDLTIGTRLLPSRPRETTILPKKTYTYLEIESDKYLENNLNFIFKVKEQWIKNNRANFTDIILNRFSNNQWDQIPLEYLHTKNGYSFYSGLVPGFSYFSISLKDSRLNNYIVTGPPDSYTVSGTIKKNRPINTEIEIINKNNKEEIKTKSDINGIFYSIIKGRIGDKIEISIPKYDYQKEIILKGDIKNLNIVVQDSFLSTFALILSITMLSALIFRRIINGKN